MERLNRFDPIAGIYDRLACLFYGQAIRKAQTVHLSCLSTCAHVAVLGGGTGWWLGRLFAQNPACTVYYIEASAQMIQRAMKNATVHRSRIRFIHGTHMDLPEEIRFDAVIAFFFLDMFESTVLAQMVTRMDKAMHPKGVWLISDFVNKKKWHAALLWGMYSFFRLARMVSVNALPDWETIVARKKIHLICSRSYFGAFIHANVYRHTHACRSRSISQ